MRGLRVKTGFIGLAALLFGASQNVMGMPARMVKAYSVPGNLHGWAGKKQKSPDGKYYVTVQEDSGTVAVLSVHDIQKGGRVVLYNIADVNSFSWIPTKPHDLIFAVCDASNAGKLLLWTGANKLRNLITPKHPKEERFVLYSVRRDGTGIIYGHALKYGRSRSKRESDQLDRLLRHRRYLRLRS